MAPDFACPPPSAKEHVWKRNCTEGDFGGEGLQNFDKLRKNPVESEKLLEKWRDKIAEVVEEQCDDGSVEDYKTDDGLSEESFSSEFYEEKPDNDDSVICLFSGRTELGLEAEVSRGCYIEEEVFASCRYEANITGVGKEGFCEPGNVPSALTKPKPGKKETDICPECYVQDSDYLLAESTSVGNLRMLVSGSLHSNATQKASDGIQALDESDPATLKDEVVTAESKSFEMDDGTLLVGMLTDLSGQNGKKEIDKCPECYVEDSESVLVKSTCDGENPRMFVSASLNSKTAQQAIDGLPAPDESETVNLTDEATKAERESFGKDDGMLLGDKLTEVSCENGRKDIEKCPECYEEDSDSLLVKSNAGEGNPRTLVSEIVNSNATRQAMGGILASDESEPVKLEKKAIKDEVNSFDKDCGMLLGEMVTDLSGEIGRGILCSGCLRAIKKCLENRAETKKNVERSLGRLNLDSVRSEEYMCSSKKGKLMEGDTAEKEEPVSVQTEKANDAVSQEPVCYRIRIGSEESLLKASDEKGGETGANDTTLASDKNRNVVAVSASAQGIQDTGLVSAQVQKQEDEILETSRVPACNFGDKNETAFSDMTLQRSKLPENPLPITERTKSEQDCHEVKRQDTKEDEIDEILQLRLEALIAEMRSGRRKKMDESSLLSEKLSKSIENDIMNEKDDAKDKDKAEAEEITPAGNARSSPEECTTSKSWESDCRNSTSKESDSDHNLSREPISLQNLHQTYVKKMQHYDLIIYHRMKDLGLVEPKHLAKSRSERIASSLRRISSRREPTMLDITLREDMEELESIYVSQICLSWDILQWQYKKVQQMAFCDFSEGFSYHRCQEKFQYFKTHILNYLENEPYQKGPRSMTFVKNRFQIPLFMQVPLVQESRKDDRAVEEEEQEEETNCITVVDLGRTMEESIWVFKDFLEAEKGKPFKVAGISASRHNHPLESRDAQRLKIIKKCLQKKLSALKPLKQKRRSLMKRKKKLTMQQREENFDIVMGSVDIMLICRVLSMSRLGKAHMLWCESKLNKLIVVNGHLIRDSVPLFFPNPD